ncbi:hypothetical protein [Cryobacterium sp. TMT1-3]|uniref:hypothetical protein n=1 Tax=Cryobacterium sp. TMT1-3 TaxID=1259237 RepID=UPI00351A7DD3
MADREFLAVGSGYRKIIEFLHAYGIVEAVGVEGTGSYGAELARVLANAGMRVLEVNRANRAERRLRGKSDPLDAHQAAMSVSLGEGYQPRNNAMATSSRCGSYLRNAPLPPRRALPVSIRSMPCW